MKAFWGAVITLLAASALVVFGTVYISSYTKELSSLADSLPTTEEEDYSKAIMTVTQMEEISKKKEPLFLLFVNHNEAESLNIKISELRTRLETDSFEDYYSKLTELKSEILEFKDSEFFSFKSIF